MSCAEDGQARTVLPESCELRDEGQFTVGVSPTWEIRKLALGSKVKLVFLKCFWAAPGSAAPGPPQSPAATRALPVNERLVCPCSSYGNGAQRREKAVSGGASFTHCAWRVMSGQPVLGLRK